VFGTGNMSNTKNKLHHQAFVVICALFALCGCRDGAFGLASTQALPGMALQQAAMAPFTPTTRRTDTLAYEHTVSIETSKDLLPTRLREVEAACNTDGPSGCTILDVSLNSQQDLPHGSIRMRLASAGLEPIISLASKDAKVTGRSTHAEDLAEPVADNERQLALLTLHRDRLTELMRGKLNVDQLITVSKELATVQSQIDALSTAGANLQRRIDTDLLTINFSLPMQVYAADQSPVMDALRSFGSNFRAAVGMVIRFLAVLLPWLVVILPGLFLLRLFWRWIGGRIVQREQRG
jgi:Domain of unknown function (DUF4349)